VQTLGRPTDPAARDLGPYRVPGAIQIVGDVTRIDEYRADLGRLDRAAWPAYLDQHSHLPGPRGNVELARALDVRTLRQALGYCWGVAVAADPAQGLPAFWALDEADPDVAWIVRKNLEKTRLIRLV
jgi:hypothetical protein